MQNEDHSEMRSVYADEMAYTDEVSWAPSLGYQYMPSSTFGSLYSDARDPPGARQIKHV
jgi:hypothetical protein